MSEPRITTVCPAVTRLLFDLQDGLSHRTGLKFKKGIDFPPSNAIIAPQLQ